MTGLSSSRMAGSEAAQNDTFGVLKLTLHALSYDWQFVPVAGKTWSDSGSDAVPRSGGLSARSPSARADH